jgi:hypothetical protein
MVKNLTRKVLYVCGTCSEHFTRRYNANRHNRNIHSDKAEIVRFLDYLIGRGSGKYLPADPLSYRTKKINKNKAATFVHENNDDDNGNNDNLYHKNSDPLHIKTQPYMAEPTQNGTYDKNNANISSDIGGAKTITNPLNNMHYLNDLFQSYDKKAKEFLQKQKIKDKIEDIKRMLYDFNPPERAQILVSELINRFNATTDYTAFNRELENYQSTLVNRYLGYANPFK